ncbi:ABC transporter substrate-binding protein [Pararobbsia silviterrae]|uniref:ABC transporter substrate-binding protein n=1 Tax=Pararobbsia silviterrae TaxID=1792498 RepID=UPI001314773E|nr:ABC transporter substrate-binding protein [Pararobbsia silviterrae]
MLAVILVAGIAVGRVMLVPHDAMSLNLVTWWTSPSEAGALNRIVSAFEASGGTLTVQSVQGALAAEQTTIRMMNEGHAPSVAQFNISRQFDLLVEDGQLRHIDAVADKNKWTTVFPVYVQSTIRRNGHFYAVPLAIHNYGAIFYSQAAFAKIGVATVPNTIDDLIADLRKMREQGVIPVAVGQSDWELKTIFDTVLLGVLGKDAFLKLYRDHDLALAGAPELTRVLTYVAALRDLTQPSPEIATWDDATRQVMDNQAGVQFMGDWADGEFIARGLSADKDFGCLPGLGATPTAIIGGDVWVFPKTDDPSTMRAQDALAEVATNPRVQVAFSRDKGSIPARMDVDAGQLDACQRRTTALVRRGDAVSNAEVFESPEESHAIRAVLMRFWHRELDVAGVQKALQNIL